jgi:uncharacterized protein YdhG (YjbR/CyaY superfamily)
MTRSPAAAKPTSTEEYLATLSAEQRAAVEQLRATVRAAVPAAQDAFSYRMPGFTLAGRPLVWIAAWTRHYSLYPVSAGQVAAAAAPGEVYEVEKGTVRFPAGAPLPHEFVARLVRVRAGEIAAGGR